MHGLLYLSLVYNFCTIKLLLYKKYEILYYMNYKI